MAVQCSRESEPLHDWEEVMGKELELKSATKNAKRLSAVRLNYDFVAFGVNSSQLSESMACMHLEWNGDHIRVTHDSFPGQEKWILPGGVKELTWKAE